MDLLTQASVLVFHGLDDNFDLLAFQHLLVVHSGNRVEYAPHDLWIVNTTQVVPNVETEDDLVEFGLLNSNSLVSQRWRQFSQEVRESAGLHVQLAHGVILSPSVLECLDVFFLECKDIVLILCLLVVIETLTDNSNEHIHKDEEGKKLEHCPEDRCNQPFSIEAVMHDTIPRLTGGCSDECHESNVEGPEVDIVINELISWHISEQTHSRNRECKDDEDQQESSVENVRHGHDECLEQRSQTRRSLDQPKQTQHSHYSQSCDVEVKFFEQLLINSNQRHHHNDEIEFVPRDIPIVLPSVSCDFEYHFCSKEHNKEQVHVDQEQGETVTLLVVVNTEEECVEDDTNHDYVLKCL